MVTVNSYPETLEARYNLGIKNELHLAVESFFVSHPENVYEHEWSKLALNLLSIIKTQKLQ